MKIAWEICPNPSQANVDRISTRTTHPSISSTFVEPSESAYIQYNSVSVYTTITDLLNNPHYSACSVFGILIYGLQAK